MDKIPTRDTILYNSILKEEKKKEERRNVKDSNVENTSSNDALIVAKSSNSTISFSQHEIELTETPEPQSVRDGELVRNQHANTMKNRPLGQRSIDQYSEIRSDPISFPHHEVEMNSKTNSNSQKMKDPIFSNHRNSEMNDVINSLETIDSDPSELVASYVCMRDGMTTRVPFNLASKTSVTNLKIAEEHIKCAFCGSTKMQRIFGRDDHEFHETYHNDGTIESDDETYETSLGRVVPTFNHFWKTVIENGKKVQVEVWAPNDNRGIGSHDPLTIMGMTKPSEMFIPTGVSEDGKYLKGHWNPAIEYMVDSKIDRIRNARVNPETELFAKEYDKFSVSQKCEIPIELKDQYMEVSDINNESKYSRNVRFAVNVPMNEYEVMAVQKRAKTRNSILENQDKKRDRILRSVDNLIEPFQVNTIKKHLGIEIDHTKATYEQLSSAQKTFFWASNWKQCANCKQQLYKFENSDTFVHDADVTRENGKVVFVTQNGVNMPLIDSSSNKCQNPKSPWLETRQHAPREDRVAPFEKAVKQLQNMAKTDEQKNSTFVIHETNVITIRNNQHGDNTEITVHQSAINVDPLQHKLSEALRKLYGKFGHKKDEEIQEVLV